MRLDRILETRWASATLLLAPATLGVLALWGYTVDDALISARVADNIANGAGYRFNAGGPVTDAVTPLGWAYYLSLFAGSGPWTTLWWARVTGCLAWLAGASLLGVRLRGEPLATRLLAALAVLISVPLAAWAVAGMETPFVTLLAILALNPSRWAALAAGAAAALRPELVPWAVTLAVLRARWETPAVAGPAPAPSWRRQLLAFVLALGPAALVACLRWWIFGSPVPLAAAAKPSDFAHGLRYVGVALVFSGPTWLLVAGTSYRGLPPLARAGAIAFPVHLASLVLAGGDWMSFFRLLVPVLPSAVLVGALLAGHSGHWQNRARLLAMLVCSSVLWLSKVPEARGVAAARLTLIERARPVLADSSAVAALDIGWVGAATRATVVDLAGVTDPVVAHLAGGHTTKRVPSSLLIGRGVDALVLLLADDAELASPWYQGRFYYGVDRRVAYSVRDLGFEPSAVLPLGGTRRHYVILRSRPGADVGQ